ncbi:Uncharacterised protein [Klebsiella pneumoniae]|nr:hypothetical protein [Klebsiella pneumoniae]SAX39439.1 Uncharacterised protein [Klebsiella pneumoniae]
MKKFICNRNGKAVFQEGDRELVAAYRGLTLSGTKTHVKGFWS